MTKTIIKGIFLKKEKTDNPKDKTKNYHFILPDVYHSLKDQQSHTYTTLNNFDIDFTEKHEEKIDKSNIGQNIDSIVNYRPLYRDIPSTYNFSHFKAKSTKELNMLVGLEYQLSCYINTYSFVDSNDGSKQINGWCIQIISIKEITTLE